MPRSRRSRNFPFFSGIPLLLLLVLEVQSFTTITVTTKFSPATTIRKISNPPFQLQDLQESKNSNNGPDDGEERFWVERWDAADTAEIRNDATMASCHTLAKFLAYDITLPIKEVPGMEVEDVVALLDTFTSCAILAVLWTGAGLVTRIFEGIGGEINWGRLMQTTMLAAPPWLLLELVLGWPAFEGPGVERIVIGSLGLLATMSLARFVSSSLLPR